MLLIIDCKYKLIQKHHSGSSNGTTRLGAHGNIGTTEEKEHLMDMELTIVNGVIKQPDEPSKPAVRTESPLS